MARKFLTWDRPALASAADYLFDRYAGDREASFADVVVAVPGARAGRRLLEILVDAADERGLPLAPPRIVTVGHLPEQLYDPSHRAAGGLATRLAWAAALTDVSPEQLRRLVPSLPAAASTAVTGATGSAASPSPQWLAIGDLIDRLHQELSGHALRFADVIEHAGRAGEYEAGRWQALAAVQAAYVARLAAIGLADQQLERLEAIERGACRTPRDIVLVGVADLTIALKRMLEQVAGRVTALVFAPPELAERFDELGGLITEKWSDVCIELADDQFAAVEGPGDQATAAVETIADYAGRFAADEITIGVPNPDIVPYLERRLEQFDLPSRFGEALRMKQSAPLRLLTAVADYLEGDRFSELAALVRHPDVEAWLTAVGDVDFLTALDEYYNAHLQSKLSGEPLVVADSAWPVTTLRNRLYEWLGRLKGERPLAEWAQEIVTLLVEIYAGQQLDASHARGRLLLEACDRIREVLVEAVELDASLAGHWTAPDAIRLLMRQIEEEPIPPLPEQAAIELLGWLELPLDDAPALIVTGFNDGSVPSFVNADPFLPNTLRRQLGVLDNDRRWARDAYALTALAGSRERLKLIAGRRSAQGDPLSPSRLLFACPPERIARRVLRFFGTEERVDLARVPPGLHAGRRPPGFIVPVPVEHEPITSLRVTQFRDYLACPYRFYLRHVLKLMSINDLCEELNPAAFGSLAHDVLREFGIDPDNSRLTDAEAIRRRLDADLDRLARERFGRFRLPAVEIQIEHLRLRLAAFARWQADWAAQGWRIVQTEISVNNDMAPLIVDGEAMCLSARLDRIDRNEVDGRHVIFDYKTSDGGKPPEKTHRCGDDWVDLQLPLYHHLGRALGITSTIELGYITLPKDVKLAGGQLAEWDDAILASARERAEQVVRDIRSRRFWPMTRPAPPFSEEFAAICQDGQFGAVPIDEEVWQENGTK
jgi:ATP-dependent helicase/nuclease subunit B